MATDTYSKLKRQTLPPPLILYTTIDCTTWKVHQAYPSLNAAFSSQLVGAITNCKPAPTPLQRADESILYIHRNRLFLPVFHIPLHHRKGVNCALHHDLPRYAHVDRLMIRRSTRKHNMPWMPPSQCPSPERRPWTDYILWRDQCIAMPLCMIVSHPIISWNDSFG